MVPILVSVKAEIGESGTEKKLLSVLLKDRM